MPRPTARRAPVNSSTAWGIREAYSIDSREYLHESGDFRELLEVVAAKRGMEPVLVEKDYWIMHCLYGLRQNGYVFHLKGGTTLSKGYGLIHRFSEDIDIQIAPPDGMTVHTGKNHTQPKHVDSRREYYDYLAGNMAIPGTTAVRDTDFDVVRRYRNGGIRLNYDLQFGSMPDLKDGILLEVGFAQIVPFRPMNFTSWALEHALASGVGVLDNRANSVPCYEPGYTLAEKLGAIAGKYRQYKEGKALPNNFMRHYYDIHCLLGERSVREFTMSADFDAHVEKCFSKSDMKTPIGTNPAFHLDDGDVFDVFQSEYERKKRLYYKGQPDFGEILDTIRGWLKEKYGG